jgi:hypothetical protein
MRFFWLALWPTKSLIQQKFMRITLLNAYAAALLAPVLFAPLCAVDADTAADRMAQLEARLIAMETRLAEAEQETKEVKTLAATGGNVPSSAILGGVAAFDIMANSAWRKLRWTQPEQWEAVRPGVSLETVIDALGPPPRSVKSLKPRVDKVFYYETSIRDKGNSLRGQISFRKGQVLTVQKPNFQ